MSKKQYSILASKSKRRIEILKLIKFDFSTQQSNIKENFNLQLPPEAFAEHWAREKAKDVSKINPNALIIGADTIVVQDSKILGKPKNKLESISMLHSLSGKTHIVITGVSFIHVGLKLDITFNDTTSVSVNKLKENDILKYIRDYKPYDKAGSYGIQDGFSIHVNSITGCYYNVMGLPVSKFNSIFQKIKELIYKND
tara:strand:+ start:444 stop:1037 length:594 start_codon:yes stop_codon:yes gene_type:complete